MRTLAKHGLLTPEPNCPAICAVSNQNLVEEFFGSLDDEADCKLVNNPEDCTSAQERIAIHNIVDRALAICGPKPEHRLAMSDDDPVNDDLIIKAMCDCNRKYLDNRFIIIITHHGVMDETLGSCFRSAGLSRGWCVAKDGKVPARMREAVVWRWRRCLGWGRVCEGRKAESVDQTIFGIYCCCREDRRPVDAGVKRAQ
ncbi:MAG: hypothetical protein ACR2PF_04930 [Rhizobiaceae bacterium]